LQQCSNSSAEAALMKGETVIHRETKENKRLNATALLHNCQQLSTPLNESEEGIH
jgi:hypothetical protein